MSRITLVIADCDELYVESVVNFFMINYSKKFQINSFTKPEFLHKYLSDNNTKTDILLINPEISLDSTSLKNIKTIIYLVSGNGINELNGRKAINKYQSADNLAGGIIAAFSEVVHNAVYTGNGDRASSIITVFSPIGGIGKTSICAALCTILSSAGKKIFYLNMENIPSTRCFFKDQSSSNISTIFYNIKSKNQNLALKIEGAKTVDSATGVHYFAPADSAAEIEEMLPEELQLLVSQLKALGQYDHILIDLSSSLNINNLAILESSDRIIIPIGQDISSEVKLLAMKEEFKIYYQRKKVNLSDKTLFLINKFNNSFNETVQFKEANINENTIKIPMFQSCDMTEVINYLTNSAGLVSLCSFQ